MNEKQDFTRQNDPARPESSDENFGREDSYQKEDRPAGHDPSRKHVPYGENPGVSPDPPADRERDIA